MRLQKSLFRDNVADVTSLPHYALLRLAGELAAQRGTRAFLVGGPVRDFLLDRPSPDIDIAVEKDCRGFGQALADRLGGRFVYHSRFLTGTVQIERPGRESAPLPEHIDITQTRKEMYRRPAVLPEVEPAPIEEDLARRDFTINAMALAITPAEFGQLLDPHHGQADLQKRLIRILHPRSFQDDPTRAFRGLRFAGRLGFKLEPGTLRMLRECIKEKTASLLTPERILQELRLICAEPRAAQILKAVLKEGLLASCFDSPLPVSSSSIIRTVRQIASQARPDLLYLYLLTLLPLTSRFPITRQEREAVRQLKRFPALREQLLNASKPSAVYRLLAPISTTSLELLSLIETKPVRQVIRQYLRTLAQVRISTTGADLRRFGLPAGPLYRGILNELLCARLDGLVTTDAAEQKLAKALVRKAVSRLPRQTASNLTSSHA